VHPETLHVKRIGGSKYPRVDDIIALEPDLVVANVEENRREDVDRLRANGIQVWVSKAPDSVAAALGSLRRLFESVFAVSDPDWLVSAEHTWSHAAPISRRAVVPVWRRPWVVLGPDTFATDVLRRLGVGNAFGGAESRYPRPTLARLRSVFDDGMADLLVLPDEPYAFSAVDGPDAFPGQPFALVSGRYLTWWGPSLEIARAELASALANITVAG
jgi:hypothetical protein